MDACDHVEREKTTPPCFNVALELPMLSCGQFDAFVSFVRSEYLERGVSLSSLCLCYILKNVNICTTEECSNTCLLGKERQD